jgi:hypothetical protein
MLTPFLFELEQMQHIFGAILAAYNYNNNRDTLEQCFSELYYFRDSGLFFNFAYKGFNLFGFTYNEPGFSITILKPRLDHKDVSNLEKDLVYQNIVFLSELKQYAI